MKVDYRADNTTFIRRHPFVSLWIALTVTPLLIATGLLVVRSMPACSQWRQQVRASAEDAMKTRYLGAGNREAVDRAYQTEGSGYADIMESLLDTAEYELADSRPFACI